MADEFPTLEIVLAACVAGLAWRGFRLFWAERTLSSQLRGLTRDAVSSAPAGAAPKSSWAETRQLQGSAAAFLGPLLRTASEEEARVTASERPDRSHVPERVRERASRMRKRLQGASARDLLGCAVLGGASLYAGAADLGVAKALFILGGLASGLLLACVLLRMRLEARVEQAEKQVIDVFRPGGPARPRSWSTRPPSGRCPACGQPGLVQHESVSELGSHLSALGLRLLVRCPSCGHVEGRIRASAADNLAG